MNLALKDIRHNFGRFALTAIGIGLLLMLVMGMGGIYRGLVDDATLLVNRVAADLWVVQKNTRGPFAEVSRIPANTEDRVRAVPGVLSSDDFVSHTIQREYDGRPLRMTVQGLSWPQDRGAWLPLIAGRRLEQSHFEMIADKSLGLPLGHRMTLGKDAYTIVGLTRNMASTSGDSMVFVTLADSQAIQYDQSGETVRLERQARRSRVSDVDPGRTQPELLNRAGGLSSGIAVLGPPPVSAVVVKVAPGADAAQVAATIASWPDVSVHSADAQRQLLVGGMVDKSRRQLGLFRALLIIVSAIIMALILYTLTLDKIHDIAVLKLMGARNFVIVNLILQQALLLGIIGYAIAYVAGQWVFPVFPRRVLIVNEDLWMLGAIVLGISVVASLLGIWRAMKVQPNEVIA
ncbi:MAG: ABC transporter permease [Planctomycetaceae bacterium]|nr:ABC transporter permease [Planctomycetaceae bacterium]